MKRTPGLLVGLTAVALITSGCRTYKTQTQNMRDSWVQGRPEFTAKEYGQNADKKADSKDSVIWHLEAGAAYRASGNYVESNRHLDAAAARIEHYEQKAKTRLANEVGANFSNPQNLPYEGRGYDKIMLHTYKALNYLSLGEVEKARPELIRAYQRQQDAVAENAKRIEETRQAEEQNKEREKVDKARADPKVAAALEGVTKDLEGFKFYADYVNPFTVYLDGLFFLHTASGADDLGRAEKSFNRVVETAGDNAFIRADVEAVAQALAGQISGPLTYVIFETGRAVSRDQVRIDIPIFVTQVSYVGAAFPELEFHSDFRSSLSVKAGDARVATLPVASMDSVIALDFKNEWPTIVTRTLLSTVTKAVANYAVNETAEQAGGSTAGWLTRIATAIGQAAVNIADTRTWSTLPKEFQVARVVTPVDRKIYLDSQEITLVDGTINVVHVRSVTPTTPLLISQFKLR